MKELTINETSSVAGGDYDFAVTLHVPSVIASELSGIFQGLIVGYLADTNALANAINTSISNGSNFDSIRVEKIEFTNI